MRTDLVADFTSRMASMALPLTATLVEFQFASGTVYASDFTTPQNNLLTNGDFEVDLSGWSTSAGTAISRVTSPVQHGSGAMKQQLTGPPLNTYSYCDIPDSKVVAGNVLSVSAYAYPNAGDVVRLRVQCYDSNWAAISSGTSSPQGTTSGYVKLTAAYTVPSNAAHLRIFLDITSGIPGVSFCYWDNIICYSDYSLEQQYVTLINKWAPVKTAKYANIFGSFARESEVEVVNTQATPFSANLANNIAESTKVIYRKWIGGTSIPTMETFYIGSYEYDELTCKMKLISPLEYSDRNVGRKASVADYPHLDPDYAGLPFNIVYGHCMNVLCTPVDAGVATTLCTQGGIDSSQTTGIKISQLPNDTVVTAPNTIYFDDEAVHFTGITQYDGYGTLSGVTRAYDGTTATAHDYGTACYVVQTEYIYLVADHPCEELGAVFVDDILQLGGYTAYNGQVGHYHPSGLYDGKAVISFATKPTIRKAVNVDVVDGISVNDTIDLGNGTHSHVSQSTANMLGIGSSHADSGTWTWTGSDANIRDNSDSTWLDAAVASASVSDYATMTVDFDTWGGGTLGPVYVVVKHSAYGDGGNAIAEISANGYTVALDASDPDMTRNKEQWIYVGHAIPATVVYRFRNFTAFSAGECRVRDISIIATQYDTGDTTVSKTGSATKSGTVSLAPDYNATADLVIGHRICVNVKGVIDGTFIENPSDIIKHFTTNYGIGLAADTGSFATAKTTLTAKSFKFAGVIRDYQTFAEILTEMSENSQMKLWYTRDKLYCMVMPDTFTSARTISKTQILQGITMVSIGLGGVKNSVDFHYDFNWGVRNRTFSLRDYYGYVKASDATSISNYGTRNIVMTGAFVTDATMAASVAGYVKDYLKNAKRRYSVGLKLDNFDVEAGDIIKITHNAPAINLTTSNVFMVEDPVEVVPGSAKAKTADRLDLVIREV